MKDNLDELSMKVNLKVIHKLNALLEKQNELIEEGKKNINELHSKINEKILNEDYNNLEEEFNKERIGKKSLRKFEYTKLNIESQIKNLKEGIKGNNDIKEENEEIQIEDLDEDNNENSEYKNYNAIKYLKNLIKETFSKIDEYEKKMEDITNEAKIKLKEGKKNEAKELLVEKRKIGELNLICKESIFVYRSHIKDFE
jgi:hypothetical protein